MTEPEDRIRELESLLSTTRTALEEAKREFERYGSIEEKSHLQTIDERDRAEEAISQAYYLCTGRSPEWSNLFGHDEALEEIDDFQKIMRQENKRLEQDLAATRTALAEAEVKLKSRPSRDQLTSDEIHATGVLCGGAVANIAMDLIATRTALQEAQKQNDGLRRRVHFLERHNQWFERCESAWCNPSTDNNPAIDAKFGQREDLPSYEELRSQLRTAQKQLGAVPE